MKNGNNILKKRWIRTLVISSACFAILAVLNFFGIFDSLEYKSYDYRVVKTAQKYTPSEDIGFIIVDQESIDWALENKGWSWPWPRESYAQIIEFLSFGGVKTVAFDMLYTEPSLYGAQDDLKLAEAQKASDRVIQTVFITGSGETLKVQYPIEPIKDTAKILGNITSVSDSDGLIRRGRITYNLNGEEIPTLGMASVFLENKKNNTELKDLPTLKDGTVLLRYQSSIENYIPYRASDILKSYDDWQSGAEDSLLVPNDFENMYVFFALYAPGLFDICSTPVSQVYPGVGVHITTLDNYLSDSFITKLPDFISYLWIFILAFIGSGLVIFPTKLHSHGKSIFVSGLGFIVALCFGAIVPVFLFSAGFWILFVTPIVAMILSFMVSLGFNYTIEGKQRRFIKSAFSQCLSKEVVNQIVNNPDSFKLGGDSFIMTAIFSDIQKFSTFSEILSAEELGELLNIYLTKMSDIIMKEKGTIDKYEGDAIVAMVGAPYAIEDHAKRACSAAIKIKQEEKELNKQIEFIGSFENYFELPTEYQHINRTLYSACKKLVNNKIKIYTRIGINSGEMIAGYFGSANKKNYTMMGKNVNLASRLEGVNKQYSTGGILISEATRILLEDDFLVRRLDRVRVVNTNNPIRLYELFEFKRNATTIQLKYIERWETALSLFEEKKYAESLQIFMELSKENSEDKVAVYYINLISNYFIHGKYPQKSDDIGVVYNTDDGVFTLLQK